MKVIVAHPNKQHSFRLAMALKKSSNLGCYITTVYNRKGSLTAFLQKIVGKRFASKIGSKRCEGLLDSEVRTFYELYGLLFLVMAHLPILKKYYRKFGAFLNNKFGIKVAKYAIKNHAEAVIMYDTTADSCFEYLKENRPEILRILDMSSNVSIERVKIYEEEIRITESDEIKQENIHIWDKNFNARNIRELENADAILVPSIFSKESVTKQGVTDGKCFLNPYGVDIQKFSCSDKQFANDGILRLVYTGGVSYGKGIGHLLDVLSMLEELKIELYLIGQYDSSSGIYKKYSNRKYIHFVGFISQSKLKDIYRIADAFVFPSLGEGLSLAALEAMAAGLPIICSTNSGVNDLVVNYENGLVFEAMNNQQLCNAIKWVYYNRNQLIKMSENAKKIAAKYTWDAYDKRVQQFIEGLGRKNA